MVEVGKSDGCSLVSFRFLRLRRLLCVEVSLVPIGVNIAFLMTSHPLRPLDLPDEEDDDAPPPV